jgi:hypothetical protein
MEELWEKLNGVIMMMPINYLGGFRQLKKRTL